MDSCKVTNLAGKWLMYPSEILEQGAFFKVCRGVEATSGTIVSITELNVAEEDRDSVKNEI